MLYAIMTAGRRTSASLGERIRRTSPTMPTGALHADFLDALDEGGRAPRVIGGEALGIRRLIDAGLLAACDGRSVPVVRDRVCAAIRSGARREAFAARWSEGAMTQAVLSACGGSQGIDDGRAPLMWRGIG